MVKIILKQLVLACRGNSAKKQCNGHANEPQKHFCMASFHFRMSTKMPARILLKLPWEQ